MQRCCEREIARYLDVPMSMVHKILCNILHYYPHKITHVKELLPADLPVKQILLLEFLASMEVHNEWQ